MDENKNLEETVGEWTDPQVHVVSGKLEVDAVSLHNMPHLMVMDMLFKIAENGSKEMETASFMELLTATQAWIHASNEDFIEKNPLHVSDPDPVIW
jgi:hypothetical protein